MKRIKPIRYAVYERKARMNANDDEIILASYNSAEEAEEDRIKYGFDLENYYVDKMPT